LEELLNKNPDLFMNETVIFNLCTMYELESEHHLEKKKKLMRLASNHFGDHFNIDCFLKNTPQSSS